MKRLFIAIKIEPEPKLIEVYNKIKHACRWSKIKWVDVALFHITLKFLGDTFEDKIPLIERVMEQTANNFEIFSFDLKGVGIFGSRYRPRVIWLGMEHSGTLKVMGKSLVDRLEQEGFENDRQNFVPHLTVGRIKYVQDKNRLQQVVSQYKDTFFQKVTVSKMILYESILKKEGPQYFPLKEVYLKK